MMPLENQVCLLDLAKRLKELGFRQDSLFYWCYFGKSKSRGEDYRLLTRGQFSDNELIVDWFSAYTVAELGKMLKETENINLGWGAWTEWNNIWKKWSCYLENDNSDIESQEEGNTEADARAKMLIYLKENNLI